MSATTLPQPPWLDGQTARLLDEFALGQAAECARHGGLDRADALLRPVLERPDAPTAASDLQARLYAQQGRLAEAERWWLKVLEKEPGHPAAQAGLARLRALQRRPVWLQPLWPLLVGLLVLSGTACLLAWQARRLSAAHAGLEERIMRTFMAQSQTAAKESQALLSEVRALSRQGQEQRAALQALDRGLDLAGAAASNQVNSLGHVLEQEIATAKEQFQRLGQQLAALQAENRNQAAQSAAATLTLSNQVAAWRQATDRERALLAELDRSRQMTRKLEADHTALAATHQALTAAHQRLLAEVQHAASPPDLAIAVPGVRTAVSGRALVLSFEEGLFDHGTHFRPDAKARLRAVAEALSQAPEPLHIQIVGHANDDRPFLKWTAQWEAGLALARASAVTGFFLEGGWFQAEQLSALSGGRPAESSNDLSPRSRPRARTVTLRLTRRAAPDVRDASRPAGSQPQPQPRAQTP